MSVPNPYSFDNIPDSSKPFYEQNPGTVFTNWLQSQNASNAATNLAVNHYNDYYSKYLYDTVTNPNSTGYFGDFLKGQSLKNYLSSFTPAERGVDSRRFNPPTRWIAF